MTIETLKKAAALHNDITACDRFIDSLTWQPVDPSTQTPGTPVSRNPMLLVELDDADGTREMLRIPQALQQEMVDVIVRYATDLREDLCNELAAL